MSSKVGFPDSVGKNVVSAGVRAEDGGCVGYVRMVASDGRALFFHFTAVDARLGLIL